MLRRRCLILLVVADFALRRHLAKTLNQTAKQFDNPLGLSFDAVETAEQALRFAQAEGDLQSLLIDHRGSADWASSALVRQLHALRPELDLYLLIHPDERELLDDSPQRDAIDGYFLRDEADPRGWFRIIQAEIQDKARTPFFDALRSYVLMAKDAWHTPGHSSGDSLRSSPWAANFHEFLGDNVLRADLSVSVDMLDSLLDPKGVIDQAQHIAAEAFGAKRTFFATNGTSTANKVIFQTLLAPGDKLLLDRHCHKSVHHGVVLSGALPIYLDSSINPKYGLFGPVPHQTLLTALKKHPDAKALILTSCTYDGLRYDLRPLIDAAHAQGLKVIIDEAWYAHARFHPELRPTALEAGADYATQSTHKVLSALSQASMIHVNDPDFDEHAFRENFNMHTSTSPQYSLIASLDVGRQQAVMEGYKLLSQALVLAHELRAAINATQAFHALDLADLLPADVQADGIRLDPTKITVDISQSGYSVDELQHALFERFNIQIEKSTFNTITLLLTVGTTRAKVARLHDALVRLATEKRPPKPLTQPPEIVGFSALKFLPRDAFYCAGEYLPLIDAQNQPNLALEGRVCADQITPYPPGIPALVPGQIITLPIVRFLLSLQRLHKRTDIHGLMHQGHTTTTHIRVMTLEEEKRHRPLDNPRS